MFCFVLFCFVLFLVCILAKWYHKIVGYFLRASGLTYAYSTLYESCEKLQKKNKCCRKSGNKGSLSFSSIKSSFTVYPDSRYRNHMGVAHSYCNKLLRLHTYVHCVSNLLCAWAVTVADKNSSVGLHVEIHCTLEYILHTWLWIECL